MSRAWAACRTAAGRNDQDRYHRCRLGVRGVEIGSVHRTRALAPCARFDASTASAALPPPARGLTTPMARNATPQSGAPRPELPLGLHGFLFEEGLKRLEDAYMATVEALAHQKQRATEGVQKTYDPPGEFSPGEVFTEEQLLSGDYHDEVSMLDEEFEETSRLIRDAFVITLFHFWERQAARWVYNPRGSYVHADIMAWLERNGFKPDTDAMQRLQRAANCLKHGPGDACRALHGTDPTLFEPPMLDKTPNSRMRITAEVLHEMFAVVWRSGPIKARTQKRGPYMFPARFRRFRRIATVSQRGS